MFACASTRDAVDAEAISRKERFILLPVVNYSDAPQAGERAEALLITLLRARKIAPLEMYEPIHDESGLPELDEGVRYRRALQQAQKTGSKFGITGTVIEWRYKTGIDSDPVVSISLRVVDIASGSVLWSASGAETGWGNDSLGTVAQSLLRDLVSQIALNDKPPSPSPVMIAPKDNKKSRTNHAEATQGPEQP